MPNVSLLLASVLLLSDGHCQGEERHNSADVSGDNMATAAARPPYCSLSPFEWRFDGLATATAQLSSSSLSPSEWCFEGLTTAAARRPLLHFDIDLLDRLCSGDRPWDRCVDYFETESDRVLQSELGRHLAGLHAIMAQVAEQLASQLATPSSVDILPELIMLNFDWLRLDLANAFNQRCSLLCTLIVSEADAIMSKYDGTLRRDVISPLRFTLDAITEMVMAEFQDQIEFESQPIRELYEKITAQSESDELASERKATESLIDFDLGTGYSASSSRPISSLSTLKIESAIGQESVCNDEEFALAKEPRSSLSTLTPESVANAIIQESIGDAEELTLAKGPRSAPSTITTESLESGFVQEIGDIEELTLANEPGSAVSSPGTKTIESAIIQEPIGDFEELLLAKASRSAPSTITTEGLDSAIVQESIGDFDDLMESLPESFDYSASAEGGLLSWLNDMSSSLPDDYQTAMAQSLPFQPWQPSDCYSQMGDFDFSGYLKADQTVFHNAFVDFFQAEWRRILKSELDDRFTPAFKQHFKEVEDQLVANLAMIADASHQDRLKQVFQMTITFNALCVSLLEGWWEHHSHLCLVLHDQACKIVSEHNLSLAVMGDLSWKLHEVMRDLEADLRIRANEAKSKALFNIWTRFHQQRSPQQLVVPDPQFTIAESSVGSDSIPASAIKKAGLSKSAQAARLVKTAAPSSSDAPQMESDRDGDITPEKDSLQENAPARSNSEIQSGLVVEQRPQDRGSSARRLGYDDNDQHVSDRDHPLNSKTSKSSRQRARSDSGASSSSSRPAMFLYHVKRLQSKMKSVKPEWPSNNLAAAPAPEPNNNAVIHDDSGACAVPMSSNTESKKTDPESGAQSAQAPKESARNFGLNLKQASARIASIHVDTTVGRARSRRPTILDKVMPPIEFNSAPMVEDQVALLFQYECRVFEQCVHNAMAAASSRYTFKLADVDRAQTSQLFWTLLGHEPPLPHDPKPGGMQAYFPVKKYVDKCKALIFKSDPEPIRPRAQIIDEQPAKEIIITPWPQTDPFSDKRHRMESLKVLVWSFVRFDESDLLSALAAMRNDVFLRPAQYDAAQVLLAFRSLYVFYRDLHQSRVKFVNRIVTNAAIQAMQRAFEQLAIIRPSFNRDVAKLTISRVPGDIAAIFADLQDSTRRLGLLFDNFITPVREMLLKVEPDPNSPQIVLDPDNYVQHVDSELAASLLDLPLRWRIKQKLNSVSCQLQKISNQLQKICNQPPKQTNSKKKSVADSVAERLISEAKPLLSDALKKFRKEAVSQPLLIKESEGHPFIQRSRQAKLRFLQKALMFNADLLIQCRVRMEVEQSLEQVMARAKQLPVDGVMARPVFRWFDEAMKSFYSEGFVVDDDGAGKRPEGSGSEQRSCSVASGPGISTAPNQVLASEERRCSFVSASTPKEVFMITECQFIALSWLTALCCALIFYYYF